MSSNVEHIVQSFASVAGDYERGRPGYAPQAIELLVREFSIGPNTRILDVGAGTGKLTRQFVDTRATLIAVEPLEEMRRRLAMNLPEIEVLEGKAESIPLPDGSIDLIVCGQSFHWFRTEESLREFHRVLIGKGGLALLWNERDDRIPWTRELSAIVDAYQRASREADASTTWQAAYERSHFFQPLQLERFHHSQLMDEETLVAAAKSRSYIATLGDAERKNVIEQIRKLVRSHPDIARESFELPFVTDLYWSRRAS